MRKIGYTARNCADEAKINAFLNKARTGLLAMCDGDHPYAVPVNFVLHNSAIYFHGMGSGRKFELLSTSPFVCFTVYEEVGTVADAVPCHADTSYFSVVIGGHVSQVTDFTEAAAALTAITQKFLPGRFKAPITSGTAEHYHSSMDGNKVAVYKIALEELTAKENGFEGKEIVR
jgi:Predicted flavin-nucleotide-binding protein